MPVGRLNRSTGNRPARITTAPERSRRAPPASITPTRQAVLPDRALEIDADERGVRLAVREEEERPVADAAFDLAGAARPRHDHHRDIALCGRGRRPPDLEGGRRGRHAGDESARGEPAQARRPAVGRSYGFSGLLLAKELLDLGDEVRGRRQFVARGIGVRVGLLVLVGLLLLELRHVLGDLGVLGDDAVQVLLELAGGLVQIGEVGLRIQEAQDAADERERGLRVLDARDVVRHVGPEAGRRDRLLAARRVEDADDPRRSFVPGRADPEARGELGIVGAAREAHGARVGHLAEEGAERQHERGAHPPGQLENALQ